MAKGETEKMSRTAESIHQQHGKISKQTAHLTSPQDSITINHQDKFVGQDNDLLHLTDSHFSEDDQECDNPSSFSHDTGPFSLSDAITTVDLTTWGPDVRRHNQGVRSMGSTDITAVVSTRGGVARASPVWQDGGYDRTFDVLAPYLSTTEGRINMPDGLSTENRDYWKEAKILRVKALEKEEMAGRMEEQKNSAFRSAPRRPRPRAPDSHTRTDERSVEKRSTEQAPVRSWIRITSPHGSSEQQHQRSPRGGAQGTGTTSRVLATHVGAAAARQLGCVFQDMEPPKSILRKGTDMPRPIRRSEIHKKLLHVTLKFETKILRSDIFAQVNLISAAPTLQNLRIGLRRETEWQEQGAREAEWKLAKRCIKIQGARKSNILLTFGK